jgi:DNA-binding MarR family transcriptional regulator
VSDFVDVYTHASKAIRAAMDTALRKHGLHLGQNLVLAELWKQDGQTPGAIAAAVHVTTPTIVKMANRMTTAGLLVRRRDDRDNRLVRLHLTEEGRALQTPIESELRILDAHLTAGMSGDERTSVILALNKVATNAIALLDDSPDIG